MNLEQVPTAALAGTWWRHMPARADPWYAPAVWAPTRWRTGGHSGALYLAESQETVWAEWYRHLAEHGLPPGAALPRDLWRWEIALDGVADLRDADVLAAVGLTPPRPGRHHWPAFQRVGEALIAAGHRGLVAPSAARPTGFVLCVPLTDARPAGARPVPPPQRIQAPPAPPTGMRT